MLALNPSVPIYLHAEPIDMRRSFDGLFGIVKADLQRDVCDGGSSMFLSSRCNRIKLMYWDNDGIAIWMKRLERGCFQRPVRCVDRKHVLITTADLQWILTGLDLTSLKKRKRYTVPANAAS